MHPSYKEHTGLKSIDFSLLVTTDAAHHSWLYYVNVKQNANYFIGDEKTNLTNLCWYCHDS